MLLLQKKFTDANTMIRSGLVCLLMGNLSNLFIHPATEFTQGVVDGATGVVFGACYAFLLLGIRANVRRRDTGEVSCA